MDGKVEFADKNLEAALKNALGTSALTRGVMADVKGMVIWRYELYYRVFEVDSQKYRTYGPGILPVHVQGPVTDLKGLEHCVNLEFLNIREQSITDVTPLTNMQKLIILELDCELLKDLTPVNNLLNLKILRLENCFIEAFSTLDSLPGLKLLGLDSVAPDHDVISKFTGLESLEITYCGLNDIRFLENVPKLNCLNLESNCISDITPLSFLKELESLILHYNSVVNLAPLSKCTELKYLDLSFNEICDISPLSNLKKLRELDLGYNRILTLEPLRELSGLERLDASVNMIRNIPRLPFDGFSKLRELSLIRNPIDAWELEELLEMYPIEENDVDLECLKEDPLDWEIYFHSGCDY